MESEERERERKRKRERDKQREGGREREIGERWCEGKEEIKSQDFVCNPLAGQGSPHTGRFW